MFKKNIWLLVIIMIMSALCYGQVIKAVEQIVLKTQKDKLSYSLGLDIGKNLKKQEIEVDLKLLTKGLADGLSTDTKPLLSDAEIKAVFTTMQQDIAAKIRAKNAQLAKKNKSEGEAFLAANKTQKGVVTLPDGLQYKEITAGTGPVPTVNDIIVVNYRGTLIDGTEFDSSYKRGQPAEFPLAGVIPGWTEALQLMKVGSKWQLFIPSNLAYGELGASQVIGPNSVLIFEVELIGIKPKEESKK